MLVQKARILNACIFELEKKISSLAGSLFDITDSLLNETKSSAGDKHETARARMQFEQKKLENQLKVIKDQFSELKRIDPASSHNTIGFGSLVTTNKGRFFIAIALGKLLEDNTDLFVISLQSPLGKKMSGNKVGHEVELNQVRYQILSVL